MPVKKDDAHRALELLEEYCARLSSPADKQLRIAIEKVIYIFKSSLFQALLDIQEFYEEILFDESKDVNSKALAVLRIADKWLDNGSLIQNKLNGSNGLMVQVGEGGPNGLENAGQSPMSGFGLNSKKSPSYHSNKSENMSLDGGVTNGGPLIASPNSPQATIPSYEDHWMHEQIILERVGLFYMNTAWLKIQN